MFSCKVVSDSPWTIALQAALSMGFPKQKYWSGLPFPPWFTSNEGFPGGSADKESACNAGDLGSIPGLGRSPGEGNGNPLQYSCLENLMDRGAWQATVMGLQESGMTE